MSKGGGGGQGVGGGLCLGGGGFWLGVGRHRRFGPLSQGGVRKVVGGANGEIRALTGCGIREGMVGLTELESVSSTVKVTKDQQLRDIRAENKRLLCPRSRT